MIYSGKLGKPEYINGHETTTNCVQKSDDDKDKADILFADIGQIKQSVRIAVQLLKKYGHYEEYQAVLNAAQASNTNRTEDNGKINRTTL